MTAGRSGNCSVRRGAALDLLDVGEALVPAAVPVPEAAEDEAGSHKQVNGTGRKEKWQGIHTAAFLVPKLKSCLLIRSGAIGLETVGCCCLEGCAAADTRDVGAVKMRGVRDAERAK